MRQLDVMWEIRDYLRSHPRACVVNLGCGLDQTGRACDNSSCRIINIDLPDIISVRDQLIPAGSREENIACDLNDHSWMDQVDGTHGVVFFAAGVFHYFRTEEVKQLVLALAKRYPGGRLVFDTVGKLGLKLMLSQILKNMGIDDINGYFYVSDPTRDLDWSDHIRVTSKGYMLGYHDMRSKGIRFPHRLLAKISDWGMKMAVHRMDFDGYCSQAVS